MFEALTIFALCVFAAFAVLSVALMWQILHMAIKRSYTKKIKLPELSAYSCKESRAVGEEVQFCVHTTKDVQAKLFRMADELVDTGLTFHVPKQTQDNRYHFWRGLNWDANFCFDSSDLQPGLYVLIFSQIENSEIQFRAPVIITPNEAPDVAVIASTNTWQAYNDFAGLSNYRDRLTPRLWRWFHKLTSALNWGVVVGDCKFIPVVPLPAHRPNMAIDADLKELNACPIRQFSHLARAKWATLKFLERNQVSYGVFSDRDFAHDHRPVQAKLIVFNTHSEYWSEEMIGRLRSYLADGGKVAFLSGNNMYRMVQFQESGLAVYDFRTDRERVSTLVGAAYDSRGYLTRGGYRITDASHWAFSESDVQNGDTFGTDDRDPSIGASGYETDKLTGAGEGFRVLAVGQNIEGPAYMVMKETEAGGWIFNTGSVASSPWINEDPVFAAIFGRLVEQAISKPSHETKQHEPKAA